MAKVEEKERRKIEAANTIEEPDPWRQHTRWDSHLGGYNKDNLRELVETVNNDKIILSILVDSFIRAINKAKQNAHMEVVGQAALFKVNSIEYGRKSDKPFPAEMEDNTDRKYKHIGQQQLCYVVRSETQWAQEDRPRYKLTAGQQTAFRMLIAAAESLEGIDPEAEITDNMKRQMDQLDSYCLDFWIQLLDHRLVGNEYDSVIISGLAVLGIAEDGSWIEACNYTPIYSAVIKLARLMVIQKAHEQWVTQVASYRQQGYEQVEAEEKSDTHFELTR